MGTVIKHTAFALILLFLACCKKSEQIIPESKMPDVMAEVYIADAIWSSGTVQLSSKDRDSSYVYGSVLAKYGYTVNDFNRSLTSYAQKGKLSKLYAEADTKLALIKKPYEFETKVESLTENQWKGRGFFNINADSAFEKRKFKLELKQQGTYLISADFKFFSNDSTQNPRFIVTMASQSDSVITKKVVELAKDTALKSYYARIVFDNKNFSNLQGYWLDYDTVYTKKIKIKYRKDSIAGGQHATISNLKIMYDFNSSARDFLNKKDTVKQAKNAASN